MDITLKRAVKHLGIDYPQGQQIVADNIALQLIELGAATRTIPLPVPMPVMASTNLTGVIELSAAGSKIDLNSYVAPVSQYDRALIFPAPPRQANAVKGFTLLPNDAQYNGAITDAELYDTEAGALSVGQSATKAISFWHENMAWDLENGESLLLQMRVKSVGSVGTSDVFYVGNAAAFSAYEGFSVAIHGPAHTTRPGYLTLNYKTSNDGSGLQVRLEPAVVTGATVVNEYMATDTYYNITLHVDGKTRTISCYVNGKQGVNSGVSKITAGSVVPVTGKRNFGIGYIPADTSFTASGAKAMRLQAFRLACLPAANQFANVALLDWQFNNNPRVLFTDLDYLGSL